MKARLNSYFFLVVAGILIWPAQNAEAGVSIYYDATVRPDHSSLQDVFSTSGTTWSASGGELTMTTYYGWGIWFGNIATFDPVPWELADNNQGNFVSVRAKLPDNSGEWEIYLKDGSYVAGFWFEPNEAQYRDSSGAYINSGIDPNVYHDYSFLLINGQVTYKIDGTSIYSGDAVSTGSPDKYLFIGDGSGWTPGGYGSWIIDEVTIKTDCPAADLDGDCDADFVDFAIFALAWSTEPGDAQWNPDCDISEPSDNIIDMLDLDVFTDNWQADNWLAGT